MAKSSDGNIWSVRTCGLLCITLCKIPHFTCYAADLAIEQDWEHFASFALWYSSTDAADTDSHFSPLSTSFPLKPEHNLSAGLGGCYFMPSLRPLHFDKGCIPPGIFEKISCSLLTLPPCNPMPPPPPAHPFPLAQCSLPTVTLRAGWIIPARPKRH